MEAIRFQQRRFPWQEMSTAKPVEETFNHSSMGDNQNPLTLQAVSSIHQCLATALEDLQPALTLKWSEMPSQFFLGSKVIHLEKITKIKACPATPVLLS
jgi:hypothetical protein